MILLKKSTDFNSKLDDLNKKIDQTNLNISDKKTTNLPSKSLSFPFSSGNEFNGIIKYLMKDSLGNIDKELNFTASSIFNSSPKYNIKNITMFDDPNNGFATERGQQNAWLCIEFKNHRIIPTHYTIKSLGSYFSGRRYALQNWVIETSNDNSSWEIIDDVKNDSTIKGDLFYHTFKIQKQQNKEIKYFRIRSPEKSNVYLSLNSLEIFGTLI